MYVGKNIMTYTNKWLTRKLMWLLCPCEKHRKYFWHHYLSKGFKKPIPLKDSIRR